MGRPVHSADSRAVVQLVTSDATAAEDSVISVCTDDIDSAYAEAQELGYEIVHLNRGMGLRRFFVRAPDGNVINIRTTGTDYLPQRRNRRDGFVC